MEKEFPEGVKVPEEIYQFLDNVYSIRLEEGSIKEQIIVIGSDSVYQGEIAKGVKPTLYVNSRNVLILPESDSRDLIAVYMDRKFLTSPRRIPFRPRSCKTNWFKQLAISSKS